MTTFVAMAQRYKNNTGITSKIGYVCKVDSRDSSSIVLCTASDTNCLGIIAEAVPFRSQCLINTIGEVLVYVNDRVKQGDVIRLYKSTDNVSTGTCMRAKSGDAPYLRIGVATSAGKGLVTVALSFAYLQSDNDSITWNDVTGKPTTFMPSEHTQPWSTITSQPTIPSTEFIIAMAISLG